MANHLTSCSCGIFLILKNSNASWDKSNRFVESGLCQFFKFSFHLYTYCLWILKKLNTQKIWMDFTCDLFCVMSFYSSVRGGSRVFRILWLTIYVLNLSTFCRLRSTVQLRRPYRPNTASRSVEGPRRIVPYTGCMEVAGMVGGGVITRKLELGCWGLYELLDRWSHCSG